MAKSSQDGNRLYRYTDLTSALHILKTKKLTLLNPEFWTDKNDSYFLDAYKRGSNLTCLAALCFTEADETYHHWHVFAPGPSGIRIQFDRKIIVKAFNRKSVIPEGHGNQSGILHRKVEYRAINDLEAVIPPISDLPFLKRLPYSGEAEYRVIFQSTTMEQETFDIPIPLTAIRRITLSPWIPLPLVKSVKASIRAIDKCDRLKVFRSTLLENEQWKSCADAAFAAPHNQG